MAVAVGVGVGEGVWLAVGVAVAVPVGMDEGRGVADERIRVVSGGKPLTRSGVEASGVVRQPAIKITAIITAATVGDSRFMI